MRRERFAGVLLFSRMKPYFVEYNKGNIFLFVHRYVVCYANCLFHGPWSITWSCSTCAFPYHLTICFMTSYKHWIEMSGNYVMKWVFRLDALANQHIYIHFSLIHSYNVFGMIWSIIWSYVVRSRMLIKSKTANVVGRRLIRRNRFG